MGTSHGTSARHSEMWISWGTLPASDTGWVIKAVKLQQKLLLWTLWYVKYDCHFYRTVELAKMTFVWQQNTVDQKTRTWPITQLPWNLGSLKVTGNGYLSYLTFNIVTLKCCLEVIQGHWKWRCSIVIIALSCTIFELFNVIHGLEIWLRGHSRSVKRVPFENLGASSVVTMAVSVAVCEIFSVKDYDCW